MRPRSIALAVFAFTIAATASAHRLDETLQATLVSIATDHVQLSIRIVPGVAVSSSLIDGIDTNHDGTLSPSEQQAFAQRVLANLTITADGHQLTPQLLSATFPEARDMRDGLGEIHIECSAPILTRTPHRTLTLQSNTLLPKPVYLVNSLVPADPYLHVLAQKRNESQSFYELDYTLSGLGPASQPSRLASLREAIAAPAVANLFRLGITHIAEGTDHLLFLLVLLLPAPLLAIHRRWQGTATVRNSLLRILKIVTAFTLGHSITLALAAFGVVRLPSHPVEVLIAVSILVSAIHALRPIFPGKEAAIAAFFGLIHGLAFASALGSLGLDRWQRIAGIFAFNLGIETMQLCVVAATLPSLLLLSRTPAYRSFRIAGALLAAIAATGWIIERIFNLPSAIDTAVNLIAHHAPALAAALFSVSLLLWIRETFLPGSLTRLTRPL